MLRAAGILCGMLLLAMSVHAGQDNKPKATKEAAAKTAPKPQKTTPKKTTAADKQTTQSGVVVAVDPTTRQIRPPTAEEKRALGQRGSQPTSQPQPIQGRGGAVGLLLGEEFHTYTVVTRTPDGQVRVDEVTGEKAAQERVNSQQSPKPGNEK